MDVTPLIRHLASGNPAVHKPRGKRFYFTFALILTIEVPVPNGPRPVKETANSSAPLYPAFALYVADEMLVMVKVPFFGR